MPRTDSGDAKDRSRSVSSHQEGNAGRLTEILYKQRTHSEIPNAEIPNAEPSSKWTRKNFREVPSGELTGIYSEMPTTKGTSDVLQAKAETEDKSPENEGYIATNAMRSLYGYLDNAGKIQGEIREDKNKDIQTSGLESHTYSEGNQEKAEVTEFIEHGFGTGISVLADEGERRKFVKNITERENKTHTRSIFMNISRLREWANKSTRDLSKEAGEIIKAIQSYTDNNMTVNQFNTQIKTTGTNIEAELRGIPSHHGYNTKRKLINALRAKEADSSSPQQDVDQHTPGGSSSDSQPLMKRRRVDDDGT